MDKDFFEIRWPVTYVNAYISDINDIEKVSLIFDNSFKMFYKNTIQPWSRWIVVISNSILEFFPRKE